jgi:hypothetical protein
MGWDCCSYPWPVPLGLDQAAADAPEADPAG